MEVAGKWSAAAVDEELDRLISKRASQDMRPDPDELEDGYVESVRRYNARCQEENRQAWASDHQDQAARLRAVFEPLIAHHTMQAQKLAKGEV